MKIRFFPVVCVDCMGGVLGQQLVVDYRPGAGGAIGANFTVKSAPDGYTVMMVAAGFVMNPALTRSLPYDPARDFTALGLAADVPYKSSGPSMVDLIAGQMAFSFPTVSGAIPHVNSGIGYGGPGGLPRAVVEHFNGALMKALQDPAVRKSMIDNGADPAGTTLEQHDIYLKSEVAKWLRVGREASIKQR